jgi:toxoflavin synthase
MWEKTLAAAAYSTAAARRDLGRKDVPEARMRPMPVSDRLSSAPMETARKPAQKLQGTVKQTAKISLQIWRHVMTQKIDQYDKVASAYSQAEPQVFRALVEAHSFFSVLGPVNGAHVLDVACGEGFYSRQFADKGAARVVGVDSSAEMIRYGQESENTEPRGIEYHVCDAAQMPILGEFDLVAATYLLHYALDLDHMRIMCERMAENLRPGGRLLTLVPNPGLDPERTRFDKYGFSVDWPRNATDGDGITLKVNAADGSARSMSLKYWSATTYEQVLTMAGFSDVRWHQLFASPIATKEYGADFFNDYLANPHAVLIEAFAPAR